MSGAELAWLSAVVAIGGFVQGSVGFAFALIVAPVLALVEPAAVPGSILLLALPMNLFVLIRERGHVDRLGATWVSVGMVPGVAIGVVVLRLVPADDLQVAFGAAIVLAVLASVLHPARASSAFVSLGAGAASGAVGTVASTGGPFVALLYQRARGPAFRSTLAATFMVGTVLALGGQAIAERLGTTQLRIAVWTLPALVFGLWASRFGRPFADRRWLRPAIYIFAAASGVVAIIRGLA